VAESDRLCSTDAERACLAKLRELGGDRVRPMELHCARVFLIAVELARRDSRRIDRELLLCAAWLHDAGLYPGAATKDLYVRDGRRLADRVLGEFEWSPERLRVCGEAIERHHEVRRQWDRGVEVELLRRADLVEVSQNLVRFGIERDWLSDLRGRLPADGMISEVGRLLAVTLRERPLTLPRIFAH
jgi:HD domain-containing protein